MAIRMTGMIQCLQQTGACGGAAFGHEAESSGEVVQGEGATPRHGAAHMAVHALHRPVAPVEEREPARHHSWKRAHNSDGDRGRQPAGQSHFGLPRHDDHLEYYREQGCCSMQQKQPPRRRGAGEGRCGRRRRGRRAGGGRCERRPRLQPLLCTCARHGVNGPQTLSHFLAAAEARAGPEYMCAREPRRPRLDREKGVDVVQGGVMGRVVRRSAGGKGENEVPPPLLRDRQTTINPVTVFNCLSLPLSSDDK